MYIYIHICVHTYVSHEQCTAISCGFDFWIWVQKRIASNCNTKQYNAAHCNTLQHTGTPCEDDFKTRVRKHTGTLCKIQHTATRCTLQHIATHCNTLQQTATHCGVTSEHEYENTAAKAHARCTSSPSAQINNTGCCSVLQCVAVAVCCSILRCNHRCPPGPPA